MPTGVFIFARPDTYNVVDDVVSQARRAHELGVRQIWLGQQFDLDAIALAGLVGAAVPGLGVGTSVVPINPRHPLIVSALAQTAQAAAPGNFSLGLGSREPERRRSAHRGRTRSSDYENTSRCCGPSSIPAAWPSTARRSSPTPNGLWPLAGGRPIPIYVAAMGPKALRVNGELADGTLPYLAGPRTIAEFIEPTISKAAAAAGRPKPQITAAVRVLVSQNPDNPKGVASARQVAVEQLGFYETIPSYQKVIAREGVDSVAARPWGPRNRCDDS